MSTVSETIQGEPFSVRFRAFLELGKLRVSSLAIFAVLAGLFLGSIATAELGLMIAVAIGSLLVAMGGNALNMWQERDVDPLMQRTKDRPIPSGRVTPHEARVFGYACAAVGLAVLAVWANLLAMFVCVLVFVLYVHVYTPLKRISTLNTVIGAIPGALPPVVGYAAGAGVLDLRAAVLFLILFFWQIPHVLAITWRLREDYAAGGFKMLSVTDPDGRATTLQMLIWTIAMIAVSLLPYTTHMAGEAYLGAAVCLNLLFLVPTVLAALFRWETAMRQTFVVSIIYLPLLLSVLVLDRVTAA